MVKAKPIEWHEEVLDARALRAASQLSQAVTSNFYLAGGTGLALQFGHRISLDLDLFSERNLLRERDRAIILERLRLCGKLQIRESVDGTVHVDLGGTPVSLFHYAYPVIGVSVGIWRGITVAGLGDISSMKLSAILGRGSKKDFVDLYWICKKWGIDRVLEAGVKKYPDHSHFILQSCRALTYFEDAEKEPMPRQILSVAWEEIKEFFNKETPKALRRLLKKV